MDDDTTGWARCTICNAVDVLEYDDGTARCENCGQVSTSVGDVAAPEPGQEILIYPLLSVEWAPCQTCGLGGGEEWDPESDTSCWDCGAERVPLKRRARAHDFPVDSRPGDTSDNLGTHRFVVGDQGVCPGTEGVHLVGGGPFTKIQIIGIRPNGDLHVAAVNDGTMWMGVPQHTVLFMA